MPQEFKIKFAATPNAIEHRQSFDSIEDLIDFQEGQDYDCMIRGNNIIVCNAPYDVFVMDRLEETL
jgi:hypothetical protein